MWLQRVEQKFGCAMTSRSAGNQIPRTGAGYSARTGSNPFRRSRGPLAAILPVFSRRFQFPIPVGLNLLLASGQHILRRDIAARMTHWLRGD